MPNPAKRLTNGWQVYETKIDAVIQALRQLRDYPQAFIEYVDWCRHERQSLSATTTGLLKGRLLLGHDGHVDENIRQVVLCAVGPDYEPIDPASGRRIPRSAHPLVVHHLNR